MLRQTVYFGQQLADSDVLSLEQFAQKDLSLALLDAFGGATAPFYSGLHVVPGTNGLLSLGIGSGRVYMGLPVDATTWGSISHGVAADPTTVLKFGSNDALLDNFDPASIFVSPGSGSNFYLLEATIAESDINLEELTFTDTAGLRTTQFMNQNRAVQIVFTVKGPSSSSTPTVDANNVGIAAITIPSGVTSMLAGYISQTAYPPFTGFATVSSGSGFVHLSPGSPDSGFVSITGAYVTGSSSGITFNSTSGGYMSSNQSGAGAAFAMDAINGGFTGNLLELRISGVAKFTVPHTGILGVAFGGSGNAAPSLIAGTGIQITGSWPNQTVAFNPSSPLPIVDGGTGTSTPALIAGTGILITGSWPNNTIQFSPGLPLPVVFGGTGTSTPALVAGGGIGILGTWPNNTIKTVLGGIGSSVAAFALLPTNFSSPDTVSISLPGASGGSWEIHVEWDGVETSSGSGNMSITVASGTVTSFTTPTTPGPGAGTSGFTRVAACFAPGNQTVTFNFNYSVAGMNASLVRIEAFRQS